jgi:HPr kinase/phosphorylase
MTSSAPSKRKRPAAESMETQESSATRIHGTLVQVVDVGVLLLGRSGIGKSETALELVMRGHRLVADDVVLLKGAADGSLIGWSHELVRHYLELRGVGIIHIPSLFGESAVAEKAHIDLGVELAEWKPEEVDRIGLDHRTRQFDGVEIVSYHLPVAPGRNIATLVEVAARTFRLQRAGRSVIAELEDRVLARLRGEPT